MPFYEAEDGFVTAPKNCKKRDILSCFFCFIRMSLKNDKWKSQMNFKSIHIKRL